MASDFRRREFLLGAAAAYIPAAHSYSFHVFGLLKPQRLLLSSVKPARAFVTTSSETMILEGFGVFEVNQSTTPVQLSGPAGEPASFVMEAPSVLRRTYRGTLAIQWQNDVLVPVVTMAEETAVSSIVGAELPVSEAPLEALAAQAILARSFLRAGRRRHESWDFCDTTHCQFLRAPAASGSAVAMATDQTRGLTLQFDGRTIAARYSAACGGRTEARRELGYLYRSVRCETCERRGAPRRGHGLGLCQEGALALGRNGWSRSRILAKYFPGAEFS